MEKRTAILVDLDFFITEIPQLLSFPENMLPTERARYLLHLLQHHTYRHLRWKEERRELVRLLIYTSTIPTFRLTHPITKGEVPVGELDYFQQKNLLLKGVKTLPFSMVRWWKLEPAHFKWELKPESWNRLLAGEIGRGELTPEDLELRWSSNPFKVMLGSDIASLALRMGVDSIILVSGDSDFVPAANLVRWERVQFIWDPLRTRYNPELAQFVDLVRTPKLPSYSQLKQQLSF